MLWFTVIANRVIGGASSCFARTIFTVCVNLKSHWNRHEFIKWLSLFYIAFEKFILCVIQYKWRIFWYSQIQCADDSSVFRVKESKIIGLRSLYVRKSLSTEKCMSKACYFFLRFVSFKAAKKKTSATLFDNLI